MYVIFANVVLRSGIRLFGQLSAINDHGFSSPFPLCRRYTASSAVVGKYGKENKGELPLLRIKARYQTVHILPMDTYHDLIQVPD